MKKILALLLALVMALGLVACGDSEPAASDDGEAAGAASLLEITAADLSMSDAFKTEMTVQVDGADKKVTAYEDCYVMRPTNYVQKETLPTSSPSIRPASVFSLRISSPRTPLRHPSSSLLPRITPMRI